MKKILLFFIIVFLIVGSYFFAVGYRIELNNFHFFGNLNFIGSENGNQYVTMPTNNTFNPNELALYEYKDEDLEKIFTFAYGGVHLIHDEILGITSKSIFGEKEFQRIDVETREITDIVYAGEIKTHIDLGGFFEVIDDDEDVIIIHQKYSDYIDGNYVFEQYVYVIDKQLNEFTHMYILDDYGETHSGTANDLLLEDGQIIFVTDQSSTSETVIIIDYKTNQVEITAQNQLGMALYLNEKYCVVSIDHRFNYTCKTIPEENVDSVLDLLLESYRKYEELFYDGKYIFLQERNFLKVYNLNGELVRENELEFYDKYIMNEKQEIIYIDKYIQGNFIIRIVFEVVNYDLLEDNEIKRSKSFRIITKYEYHDGDV